MIVVVMTGCDHFCKHGYRIGNSTTIHAAMQITIRACYFHFNVAESAHADID